MSVRRQDQRLVFVLLDQRQEVGIASQEERLRMKVNRLGLGGEEKRQGLLVKMQQLESQWYFAASKDVQVVVLVGSIFATGLSLEEWR